MAAEIYTNGYGEVVLRFMKRRTLASHGKFILPFLEPGQRILDLGCGPGNMTLEIAQKVAPHGSVIGVDKSADQFEEVKNQPVSFRTMDAYRLEFADNTFDGVFSHALFEHVARPVDILREVRRVLKPGGFVGLRSPDWGGMVIHPQDDSLRAALQARNDLQTRNGGNIHAGRHLREWAREAGFNEAVVTANYEVYEDNAFIADHIAAQLENIGAKEHADAWRKWEQQPEAMFAQAWFEVTARKNNL